MTWHSAGTALAQRWYGMNSDRWCTDVVAGENGNDNLHIVLLT